MSLQRWLEREGLTNPEYLEKLAKILSFVDDDNLYVSFVSEYSRGKTELINTLFFSQYGKRILPSGIGRTTMCPTEFFYNANQPLGISLLPIETSSKNTSLNALKNNVGSWSNFSIDTKNTNDVINAFKRLQETIRVPAQIAHSLGFPTNLSNESQSFIYDSTHNASHDGLVEIPKWRHALVNIKHPLLAQKLVILDTPGLNAVGTETNLTINQLPKSHSIVFLLDSSTGVTKSDFELWSKHIKLENNASRIIALNKIDSLWDSIDGIDNEKTMNDAVNSLASQTAKLLHVERGNIFPVSAKYGLIGKIHKRKNVIKKSRIFEFERALVQNLVPSKKKIVLTNIFPLAQAIAKSVDEIFNQRSSALEQHEQEITATLKKNEKMRNDIKNSLNDDAKLLLNFSEQHTFIDASFAKSIKKLRQFLDISAIEREEARCKSKLKKAPSIAQKRSVLLTFLRQANQKMHLAVLCAIEVEEQCMKISNNDNFKNDANVVFRRLELDRHLSILNSVEQSFLSLDFEHNSSDKKQIKRLEKTFKNDSLTIYRTFKRAFNETNDWQRTLISPLETRVRNQSKRLSERKNNVNQLAQSNKNLKERLAHNHANQDITIKQKTQLYALIHNINKNLIHSGYTEQNLYQPIERKSNNVIKMKPSAS